jgi:hypothetical protein
MENERPAWFCRSCGLESAWGPRMSPTGPRCWRPDSMCSGRVFFTTRRRILMMMAQNAQRSQVDAAGEATVRALRSKN